MRYVFHMNIYLLRHGIAVEREEWSAKSDADRPLTVEGEQQLRTSCAAMRRMGLSFELILSSPYERAKQTAVIVGEELGLKKQLKFSEELRSEGDPAKCVRELAQWQPEPKDVLLVGHEPYLSGLVSMLVTGKMKLAMDFKKGGLCRLKTGALEYDRCASLVWLLTPKQMALMR